MYYISFNYQFQQSYPPKDYTNFTRSYTELGFSTYFGTFLPLPIYFTASSLEGTCSVTVLQASQANVKI